MQTYELMVRNRIMSAMSEDTTLVRTSRGVDKLRISFDSDEWTAFPLTCALSVGGNITEIPITLQSSEDDELPYAAEFEVPDEALESAGPLGVTVHGTDGTNHIITGLAYPLAVEVEGDSEGDAPSPNPS